MATCDIASNDEIHTYSQDPQDIKALDAYDPTDLHYTTSSATPASLRSQSSSLADKSDYSDDIKSTTSTETVSTMENTVEKQVASPAPVTGRRRRGSTVTQPPPGNVLSFQSQGHRIQEESELTKSGDVNENQGSGYRDTLSEIHDLQGANSISEHEEPEETEEIDIQSDLQRARKNHRSTMISMTSYMSSASNYDMLLERLAATDDTHASSSDQEDTNSTDPPSEENVQNENENQQHDENEIDWEFWSKVISDFSSVAKSERKVLSMNVQRGIPPSVRGMVWQLFAGSKDPKLEDKYMQLLKEESVYEKAIVRDLSRTFPHHPYFQSKEGQDALFNVVKAFSLYDTNVGYCQGISFIAGPLLLNMPEEEAFCVLVQMMQRYGLRGHFTPQMDTLHQRLHQFAGLLSDHLPHVYRHFEAQGVRSNMYASQWFMTLFAYKFPLDFVFRIYDILLAEGIEAIHRIALALIEKNQSMILSLEFDDLVNFLKSHMIDAYDGNPSGLIHDAYQIQIVRKRLDRLAKEYQVEAARANTEAEAIETLRRQNKALSETVRHLEQTMENLNKEHALVASQLIASKMDIARTNDENDALRQQANDLKRALETLPGEVEARVKEEMEILCTKNGALVQRNAALEDQLAYMENMVIEMKVKYADSENEREGLRQRLNDLKKLMGHV
ncbi:rab-GTPase-TBC domain-containing protein [Radiomyces spectabilis]|uniref:rab-GTPase-TBC domain-containing protein n=1 Tax=Radiomyces spectabilis TaxID=64574 RepID=UPI00221FA427|nr:rab-GTPase-TBC domain-containing protein [Radiomyces spectabilis]KAI8388213.1 rab-GTPase-TBC domain-containing protein [Radiomyces spectabilis]